MVEACGDAARGKLGPPALVSAADIYQVGVACAVRAAHDARAKLPRLPEPKEDHAMRGRIAKTFSELADALREKNSVFKPAVNPPETLDDVKECLR